MKSETELWRAAHDEVRNGRRAVMCTVIQGKGSIPRELGARMLIGEVGTLAGTIGGGCGEADVLVAARKAIAGAEFPRFVEVDLAGSLEQDEVQACGGTMRVFVRLLDSSDEGWIAKLAHAEAEHEPMIVIEALDSSATQVVSESDNEHAMAGFLRDFPAQGAKLFRHQDEEYFAQRIGTSLRLVLVGSGHVAMPLCEFAAKSGFAVTVVDDRPSYVTQARFPDAE
ncbi:MAG: XdhC family protein, partial [Planctomycetes bacterium]|nr:XdhC family protein [Planctomycetota bacterium]